MSDFEEGDRVRHERYDYGTVKFVASDGKVAVDWDVKPSYTKVLAVNLTPTTRTRGGTA